MSAQPAIEIFDEIWAEREGMKPAAEEADKWVPRSFFSPFRDKRLAPMDQSLYGIKKIRHGVIQPITPFDRTELDYKSIARVSSEDVVMVPGVSETLTQRRAPKYVVASLVRRYGEHGGAKTGFREIEALQGVDDFNLIRELQTFCLPVIYSTWREQLAQLTSLNYTGKSQLFRDVGEALLASTMENKAWADHHMSNLIAALEAWGNGDKQRGKSRLSPLDGAVCKWIEVQEPKIATKLAAAIEQPQQRQVEEVPQIQCGTCGEYSNLLPTGEPPKLCRACKTSFVEEVSDEALSEEQLRRTQRQAEMKARQK